VHPVRLQQGGDRDVVGVVADQLAVGVDDRVHGPDAGGGGVEGVDERDDVLLVGHGHARPADVQAADAGDGGGDVGRGDRLVEVVEAEPIVQPVVETHPVVARAGGQGDAQHGFAVDVVHHAHYRSSYDLARHPRTAGPHHRRRGEGT